LGPDEIPRFTAGAALNTDDNALIEFAAPRDLLGYRGDDHTLARIYGADWPFGQLGPLLRGFVTPADFGRLAVALLEHGRVREAGHAIERAEGPAGARARALLGLLANALPLPEDLDPPRLGERLPVRDLEKYAREYADVERLARAGAFARAQAVLDAWPQSIADSGGQDLALLYGYVAWRAGALGDADDALEPLLKDASYLRKRPLALFVLGRVHYASAEHRKGVGYLARYLDVGGGS
jgi:hypothetical protein